MRAIRNDRQRELRFDGDGRFLSASDWGSTGDEDSDEDDSDDN